MNVLAIIFWGVCAIILCGGLVNWINIYMEKQTSGKKQDEEFYVRIEERLTELERRLSDIQEVVLAIDEKLEHFEMKQAK